MEFVKVATEPTKAQVAANCPCKQKLNPAVQIIKIVEVKCKLRSEKVHSPNRNNTSRKGNVTKGQVT